MVLILLLGLILIGVAVFRNRDNPSRLPLAAIPGAALVLVYLLGGHIHFGAAASVLLVAILLASMAAATVMQIGKSIGRIPDIPSGTLAFAGIDMVLDDVLTMWEPLNG